MDEDLLEELDRSDEVRRDGRSAVVRRATADYLRRNRRKAIADQYRRGYSGGESVEDELEAWAEEGVWPEK